MSGARIEVLAGPDAGRRIELPLGARWTVGASSSADVRLAGEGLADQHLLIERGLTGLRLTPLEPVTRPGGGCLDPAHSLREGSLELLLGAVWLRLTPPGAAARATMPRLPGVELLEPLGRGAAAAVLRGRLLATGEEVAVKLLDPSAGPHAQKRFEQEGRLGQRLEHPAIARVLATGRAPQPYVVRQLVPGRSLDVELENGPWAWRRAVRLGVEVAQALAYAHGQGLVHRDVKPANLIVRDDGGVSLIDFDLARSQETLATRLTGSGEGLGSLLYLAPEQLTDARHADARADLYGLGATLYHALTGRAPFAELAPEEYFVAKTGPGPRPLAELVPELPAGLAQLLTRCLAAEPDRRPASAAALALELTGLLS